MAGTGLPTGDRRRVFIEPAPLVQPAGALAEAEAWGVAATIAKDVSGQISEIQAASDARTAAENDLSFKKKAIELKAKYPDDPAGFEKEWTAFTDESLRTVADMGQRFAPSARRGLAQAYIGVYDSITTAAATKEKRLSADAISARIESANLDALDRAAVGDQKGVLQALDDQRRFLDAGVTAGFWTPDYAALEIRKRQAATQGETVLAHITGTFWGSGADAAKREIETLGLTSDRGFDVLAGAVKGQESGGQQFGPDGQPLTSKAGAVGIMQIMPGTGPEAAAAAGLPWDEKKFRTDAGYNETLGKAYLRKMLDKYDGNRTLALAAYNAGPGSVDGWLKTIGDPRDGKITNADFTAAIPFKETRGYVASVTAKAAAGGDDRVVMGPEQRERLKARALGRLAELENQASGIVLQWADGLDPLQAYSMLTKGQAGTEASAAYRALSVEGQVKARKELLSLASATSAMADRQERHDAQRRERMTNQALYDLVALDPAAPDYLAQHEQLVGRARALGTISPDAFAKIVDQGRNAGIDNPALLFSLEDRIERGVITSGEDLVGFIGQGLTYSTGQRLLNKLNLGSDERYKTGLARIRAASGLVEGGLFNPSSGEAKAASRMRIAFDDAIDTARKGDKPFDPVEIAKTVISSDQAQQHQQSNSPLALQYKAQIKEAADKVRAAGLRDAQGNAVALDFDSVDDIEAARRLSDPNSGLFGIFKRGLFNERELSQLRTAIQQTHGE